MRRYLFRFAQNAVETTNPAMTEEVFDGIITGLQKKS